eukprot:733209-Rhodomonas_salina.1
MAGTDRACGPICLRACYAMCGTAIAYGATELAYGCTEIRYGATRAWSKTRESAPMVAYPPMPCPALLSYTVAGTDKAYDATSAQHEGSVCRAGSIPYGPTPCPVLMYCIMLRNVRY